MADSRIVILTSLIWRGFRVERPGTLKLMLEKQGEGGVRGEGYS